MTSQSKPIAAVGGPSLAERLTSPHERIHDCNAGVAAKTFVGSQPKGQQAHSDEYQSRAGTATMAKSHVRHRDDLDSCGCQAGRRFNPMNVNNTESRDEQTCRARCNGVVSRETRMPPRSSWTPGWAWTRSGYEPQTALPGSQAYCFVASLTRRRWHFKHNTKN